MDQSAQIAKAQVDPATPVQRVRAVFGLKKAAQIVDLTPDAVKKWGRPLAKGGQGGLVPSKYQRAFLEAARAQGLDLSEKDLIGEAA